MLEGKASLTERWTPLNGLRLRHHPREWQRAALAEWKQCMRGVVSVVTGGGKTTLALMCILEFLQRFRAGRVFVIVPTKALLDQWVLDLKSDLNATDEEISVFSGEERSNGASLLN
jgi:superfamily II DNA or RNA helicase